MKRSLLDCLACPDDSYFPLHLTVRQEIDGEIVEGDLKCPQCNRLYPIRESIPELLSKATFADAVKTKEIEVRDQQASEFESFYSHYHTQLETALVVKTLAGMPQGVVLGAGCGTGRMLTHYAATVREVVGVDFSRVSLVQLERNLKKLGIGNVRLVQGDLNALPFRNMVFDACVSCEVLEHLPTPEGRSGAIRQIAEKLKGGGLLICTIYNFSLRYRLQQFFGVNNDRARKEGFHSGGQIYFYNFSSTEARKLFSSHFHIERLVGIDSLIPIVTSILGPFRNSFDSFCRLTGLGRLLGACLLIVGKK